MAGRLERAEAEGPQIMMETVEGNPPCPAISQRLPHRAPGEPAHRECLPAHRVDARANRTVMVGSMLALRDSAGLLSCPLMHPLASGAIVMGH